MDLPMIDRDTALQLLARNGALMWIDRGKNFAVLVVPSDFGAQVHAVRLSDALQMKMAGEIVADHVGLYVLPALSASPGGE